MAGSSRAAELNVGLLWHSINSGNLGVGALTVSNIALASRAAERAGVRPNFTVVGFRDRSPQYVAVPSLQIDAKTLLDPRRYWTELKGFDCLLDIGGGDSFADIYGAKRFAYLWLTKALAIARRKPLLLSPQTIGPFSGVAYRKLAGAALRGSSAVFARDHMSMAAIQDLAPTARAFQSVDVAFALPYTPAERSSDRVRIGLNVSGLLFNRTLERAGTGVLGYNYADLVREIIKRLTSDPRNPGGIDLPRLRARATGRRRWSGRRPARERVPPPHPSSRLLVAVGGEVLHFRAGFPDCRTHARLHCCLFDGRSVRRDGL